MSDPTSERSAWPVSGLSLVGALGGLPGLLAVVVAGSWLAGVNVLSGWPATFAMLAMVFAGVVAVSAVGGCWDPLGEVVAHWPLWLSGPVRILTCTLALVTPVVVVVVLVSGPTPWLWLAASGPVAVGVVIALGAATSHGRA